MSRTIERSVILKEISVEGYEKILTVTDDTTGLKAIICIHNTVLGPALGGIRIYPYPTFDEALFDVQRLAFGMTYKSALAESGLGGGKSVIICDPKNKTKELLISFAQAVDSLEGLYTGAEDIGCDVNDVTLMNEYTPYMVGTNHNKSSGNPSFFTAWGTFRGIQATLEVLDGSPSVEGKKIAIQGAGSVGAILADILFWHGSDLIVADIDVKKTEILKKKYKATVCSPDAILSIPCDILAPCAMGGIINAESIPLLNCRGIAGSANNQLLSSTDADELKNRGILYAPDFVINAGGLINVSLEIEEDGYSPTLARKKTDQVYDQLIRLFEIAEQNHCSTHHAAISLGDYRIKYGVGKRRAPPCYHQKSQINIERP